MLTCWGGNRVFSHLLSWRQQISMRHLVAAALTEMIVTKAHFEEVRLPLQWFVVHESTLCQFVCACAIRCDSGASSIIFTLPGVCVCVCVHTRMYACSSTIWPARLSRIPVEWDFNHLLLSRQQPAASPAQASYIYDNFCCFSFLLSLSLPPLSLFSFIEITVDWRM